MKNAISLIPHSSTEIPAGLRKDFICTDEELARNLDAFTDWKTDELYNPCGVMETLVYPVSRMVCDPERFRSDADEPMAARGIGALYTHDAFGKSLRNVTEAMRAELLARYYDPYHAAMKAFVDAAVAEYGRCMIVDCHSFSGMPLPYEPEQNAVRPDVCIGYSDGNSDEELVAMVSDSFRRRGYSVAFNTPYAGSMVPLDRIGDGRVASIMIELNRRLYKHDGRFEKTGGFTRLRTAVLEVLRVVADYAETM